MIKRLRTPKFWYDKKHSAGKILSPLSSIYSFLTNIRYSSILPSKTDVPVISVNSVMISGAGKTPTVALVYDILRNLGFTPHILTRGYSGYIKNVIQVNPTLHSYLQVGDESLVSAQFAPTWIGRNHFKESKAAIFGGADILVVDSGFYCRTLFKDFNILVIDANQQFGNERLLPAGPLIEPVDNGIKNADMVLIIGNKSEDLEKRITSIKNVKICYASLQVSEPVLVENNKVLGFCGLGYPQNFKKTLIDCKYEIVDFVAFADHHPYTITEIQRLIEKASSVNATLVTTLKDYVKIPEVFRSEVKVIPVKVVPSDNTFIEIISAIVSRTNKQNLQNINIDQATTHRTNTKAKQKQK